MAPGTMDLVRHRRGTQAWEQINPQKPGCPISLFYIVLSEVREATECESQREGEVGLLGREVYNEVFVSYKLQGGPKKMYHFYKQKLEALRIQKLLFCWASKFDSLEYS